MHVLEGQPKLKCQQCDKTFKLKEYLDRHKKNIHEKEPQNHEDEYKCDRCNKAYSKKGILVSHIRSKHENGMFKCKNCKRYLTLVPGHSPHHTNS